MNDIILDLYIKEYLLLWISSYNNTHFTRITIHTNMENNSILE